MQRKAKQWRKWSIGWSLTIGFASRVGAQVPIGDGVEAIYYKGTNFERMLMRRREATISDENWGRKGPLSRVPAEFFSVRWTGWLVPPISGRYMLYFSADDGVRIWLDDKLVLDEWSIHPVEKFSIIVQLRAKQPYKIRVDYFQSIIHTRARLTWVAPIRPEQTSWRNVWGLRASVPKETVIPTRYLFTRLPGNLIPKPSLVVASSVALSKPKFPPKAIHQLTQPPQRGRSTNQSFTQKSISLVSRRISHKANKIIPPDSMSGNRVAQLNAGREVILPELHFDQGQATLLPAARAVLDELAIALHNQPALRLEVQGHTDNQGNAELNRQLSQQRAETVCLYLIAHGVNSELLWPVGYGGTRPVADNDKPYLRTLNRRVVLVRR